MTINIIKPHNLGLSIDLIIFVKLFIKLII